MTTRIRPDNKTRASRGSRWARMALLALGVACTLLEIRAILSAVREAWRKSGGVDSPE